MDQQQFKILLRGPAQRSHIPIRRALPVKTFMLVLPVEPIHPLAPGLIKLIQLTVMKVLQHNILTLVDQFSRVSPVFEVARSIAGRYVVAVLESLKLTAGLPKVIKLDKGPEFTGRVSDAWAHKNRVNLDVTSP
jgi:hypothetical protein